jgi:hypothetical protein
MRTLVLASIAALALLASPAHAEDTKPPVISDVKASAKGGKVNVEARITDETGVLSAIIHHRGAGGKIEDSNMVKNDYDDVFKASFAGSGDTEYWIESSDLLGNGPSTYGSASKPFTASGKAGKGGGSAVATKEPAPRREAPPKQEEPPPQQEQPAAEPEPKPERRERVAKVAAPPMIEHRQPSAQPPEGRDFTVRMKIKSESPVAVAILKYRPQGTDAFANAQLEHGDGDSYDAVIPAAVAKGSIEYFIAAKNQAGQMAQQGNGDAKTPYVLTFKSSAAAAAASASAAAGGAASAAGPFQFAHLPLFRVLPGKPIVVRAQITPSTDGGNIPDRALVLWRGNDGTDQIKEMSADPTGGYGGFRAELTAQDEGGVYYQIVACDQGDSHCAADTGGKRKWHSAAVSAQQGGAQPMPIDSASANAPASLPE